MGLMGAVGEHDAIINLMADYVHLIDEDRLEEWVELFTDDCTYKILSRENVEAGYPLELMSCHSKGMLRDRVVSLREANLYNLHTDKHVLSVVRVQGSDAGVWSVQANFSVYQSTLDGETDLFAVGTYRDKVVFDNGHPLFAEKIVVNDTFAVARMLSTPI
ncbi:MAG: aromatic-ring-hydroxylating dioxygenase subunit beta [Acidimicrobiaceae bacterium]|nr:aromatic-ring-hydroxylating dioxygenase subunit beta [Acidimicrobiaceae bacterium]